MGQEHVKEVATNKREYSSFSLYYFYVNKIDKHQAQYYRPYLKHLSPIVLNSLCTLESPGEHVKHTDTHRLPQIK